VVSLVAELRVHEPQAAEELAQWKTVVEERKVIDTSPAAITLAPLLTGEELDSLGRGAGDGEEGAGVRVVIDVQAPAPAAGQAAGPNPPRGGLLGEEAHGLYTTGLAMTLKC
jgi:hypothetical protein